MFRRGESAEEKLSPRPPSVGMPRPPKLPKPSGAHNRGPDLIFESYNLCRPALLEEVTNMVTSGLRRLEKEKERGIGGGEHGTVRVGLRIGEGEGGVDAVALAEKARTDRLAVYRSAFIHYIESSTLYKPFLREVLTEFDSGLSSLGEKLRMYSTYDMEKQMVKAAHAAELRSTEDRLNKVIATHVRAAVAAEKKALAHIKTIKKQEEECEELRISTAVKVAEWDEMRVTCMTLTKSLQRYADASKIHKHAEAVHLSENAKLVVSERKATEECERLRLKTQELEAENALLVSHEELERKTTEIEDMKRRLRYQEDQHKLLLQRYGLVKSAIEHVYKKQYPMYCQAGTVIEAGGSAACIDITPRAVGSTLISMTSHPNAMARAGSASESGGGEFLTAMSEKPEVVAEVIGHLGGDIRAAMEALLDHIRLLSKNRAINGVNAVPVSGIEKIFATIEKSVTASTDDETELEIEWQGLDDGGSGKEVVRPMLDEVATDSWPAASTATSIGQDNANSSHLVTKATYSATETLTHTITKVGDNNDGENKEEDKEDTDGEAITSAHTVSLFNHFEGLGDDMNIPGYLRMKGSIQNMFFRRTDTGKLISLIMRAARIRREFLLAKLNEVLTAYFHTSKGMGIGSGYSSSNKEKPEERLKELLAQPFSIFFEAFLRKHFFSDAKVVQVAFNLLESAKKFSTESDCRLFLLILNDDLPQDVWYDQDDGFKSICTAMIKRAGTHGTIFEGKRRLTVEDFMRTLHSYIPHKSATSMRKLQRALALENKSSKYVLDIPALLLDTGFIDGGSTSKGGTGTRGMFCELLRLQHISESSQFYATVLECIDTTCGVATQGVNSLAYGGIGNSSSIASAGETQESASVSTFRKALLAADEQRPRAEVNAYLARGLGVTLEELLLVEAKRLRFPIADFKRRLRAGLLKKSVPVEK